ncbi:MAG TPA: GAF domain-containing protein, partial [Anaerolineae bacterium]|nr:GAF domain-containing protein [Anaerolineae bacterium]
MQPSSTPPDLIRFRQAWQQFVSSGRLLAGIDPLVVNSWLRSSPRLNPLAPPQWAYLSGDVMPLTLNQHASFRAIARPIMEDVHQFIEGVGLMLLLVDSTTCVLELLGDRSILDYMTGLGLRQGAFLDESRLGTNAFATALIEGCPAQVIGAEHYLSRFHSIGCSAAPIFDVDGGPVGAIGVLSRAEQYCRQS